MVNRIDPIEGKIVIDGKTIMIDIREILEEDDFDQYGDLIE